MTTVDLDFGWLIFAALGIILAIVGCARESRGDDTDLRNVLAKLERD